ncbi:MAG: restriction endonuclease subunit S [Roseomonas sp.]|nr:restriction endonuclease subunit S [Roseomonas sp.]
MRLAEVCTTRLGYTARARLEASGTGVLAIQLRDMAEDGLDIAGLSRVLIKESIDRYLVQAGDVLFRSRGERNSAIALDDRFAEPAVAVSPLMVLRPMRNVISADYLAWAINQPEAQRHFDLTARGTSIRMVSKASLDELNIDVPDAPTQRRIVAAHYLAARERALTHLLADTKQAFINRTLAERAKSKRTQTTQKERRK